VAVVSAGQYENHLHLIPDNHASTRSFNFHRPDALLDTLPITEGKKHLNTQKVAPNPKTMCEPIVLLCQRCSLFFSAVLCFLHQCF